MSKKLKVSIFAGFFVLLFIASAMVLPMVFPLINDVTTNPQNPPSFFADVSLSGVDPVEMTYPKDFEAIQRKVYPYMAPMVFSMSSEALFTVALQVAKNQPGWAVIAVDQGALRFQAIAETPKLKFKDDVVVSVSGNAEQSTLDMRSRSRVGRSDFGANHARIIAFLNALPSD